MQVRIEERSDVPVFQQIVGQIKAAVARGVLRPGELIPSVRQIAAQALVNPNTVAKAYRELEREGVITTRRGLGLAVAADAPSRCREDRCQAIRTRLTELVTEARRAGIADVQLRQELEKALGSTAATGSGQTPGSGLVSPPGMPPGFDSAATSGSGSAPPSSGTGPAAIPPLGTGEAQALSRSS